MRCGTNILTVSITDGQHLRIRAEADGVALNARSSGVTEVDVRGLQALARKLAESASGKAGTFR
jgi:hypothetical protein